MSSGVIWSDMTSTPTVQEVPTACLTAFVSSLDRKKTPKKTTDQVKTSAFES